MKHNLSSLLFFKTDIYGTVLPLKEQSVFLNFVFILYQTYCLAIF